MAVILTITVDSKDYGFDFDDQRIDIDATLDTLDVSNLYTAIKEAQEHEDGIVFKKIADAEGLTTLSPGIATFLTVILLESWEVNTLQSSGSFSVQGGNLVRDDGSDPFRDNPLITYINNLSQAGVVAETGVSGLTPTESTQLLALGTPDDIWDEVVDGILTARQSIRLLNAAMAGKLSGAGSTNVKIRDIGDTKDRIDATVDANGNRTAVTTDVS